MSGLEVVCAVFVAVILILAIIATLVGIAKGRISDTLNWHFNAGEWFKLLGQCAAVIAAALTSSE